MKVYPFTWVLLTILLISNTSKSQTVLVPESIEGTWVSESDSLYKLIFDEKGVLNSIYDEETQTYHYSISIGSHECNHTESAIEKIPYLTLINTDDSSESYCYEINGISEKILSIRYLGNGGHLLFYRM